MCFVYYIHLLCNVLHYVADKVDDVQLPIAGADASHAGAEHEERRIAGDGHIFDKHLERSLLMGVVLSMSVNVMFAAGGGYGWQCTVVLVGQEDQQQQRQHGSRAVESHSYSCCGHRKGFGWNIPTQSWYICVSVLG